MKSHTQARYGITLEEYDGFIADASGACQICGVVPDKSLHLDHCHETGAIRGALCSNCNTALGLFNDKVEIMMKAISYLTSGKGGSS
jgi:hypothetical protein